MFLIVCSLFMDNFFGKVKKKICIKFNTEKNALKCVLLSFIASNIFFITKEGKTFFVSKYGSR